MSAQRLWSVGAVVAVVLTVFLIAARPGEAAGPFYVVAGEALLRDCPSPDCGIITRLYRSDQVEYLDTNSYGWWKVRVLRTGVVGWVTADLLSAVPSPPPPSYPPYSPYYSYVTVSSTALRAYPMYSSSVTGSVQLNDRVERLGESPQGWTKVRSLRDGSEGWMLSSYLSPQPSSYPRRAYSPKKRIKRSAPAADKEDKEDKEDKAPAKEKVKPM